MQKKRFIFGNWEETSASLTRQDVVRICNLADSKQKSIRSYPQDKILRVCGELQKLWSNPEYIYRQELLNELPAVTGFSKEMIVLALEELANVFDPALLERKLKNELKGLSRTQWTFDPKTGTSSLFQPLGTVLHILSGNVFLVAVGSLIEGWITGNVTILKMSSSETSFLPRFIESLRECDPEGILTESLAVIDYPSSEKEVIEEFKKRVDGILVWGGEEAVKAYRNGLPARTRIILYGPRFSFAIVTAAGLVEQGIETVADKLSLELAIWDQNACTAPQVCFVESMEKALLLAPVLADKLRGRAKELPAGSLDPNSAVEIQKWRSVAEVAHARGEGACYSSLSNVDWTVIVKKETHLEPSPLHRTIKLVPFDQWEEVTSQLKEMRGYLQTVGLSASQKEKGEVSRLLLSEGVLRILEMGGMFGGEIDDPHDGLFDLPQFGNTVFTRLNLPSTEHHPIDCLSEAERKSLLDEKFRSLMDTAARTDFYKEVFNESRPTSIEEIKKLPLLARDLLDKNIPPKSALGRGLASQFPVGGYVARSGGSTGEPKFSVFDGEDWETLVSEAVRVLRNCGLRPGDRVANCMFAGDMYGSFVSFDHINFRAGAMSFAFAGQVSPEVFLKTWKEFRVNVVEGMPTTLIPLFQQVLALDPSFTIEKMIYGGTPLTPHDRAWLTEKVGIRRIASIIGANDGGHYAFQCEKLSGNLHHTVDDFNFVEIVDEAGQEVSGDEEGKILITSLRKKNYPLIRYEIGDKGRWVEGPCSCGRTNRVFEYLGRSDDTVCVGMMNFRYSDLLKSLKDFSFSVLQLVTRADASGESLIVRVEAEGDAAMLARELESQVYANLPVLKKRVEEGYLASVTFEVVPPFALPRNPRTGKVRLMIDERF